MPRAMEVPQMIETKRHDLKAVLSEAEIALRLIEEHDLQNNLPGAKAQWGARAEALLFCQGSPEKAHGVQTNCGGDLYKLHHV